jgi:hypothetical protein
MPIEWLLVIVPLFSPTIAPTAIYPETLPEK